MNVRKMMCCAAVAAMSVTVGVRAQEETGETGAAEDYKAKMQEFRTEKREIMKSMMEAQKKALQENEELAEEVQQIDEQIRELKQKRDQVIEEAVPEVAAAKERLKQMQTEYTETMKQMRGGKEKPVREKGAKKAERKKNK